MEVGDEDMKILGIEFGEMEGNCEYCGDDFTKAQRASKRSGLPIYEHDQERGYFIVADFRRFNMGYLVYSGDYSTY